MTGFGLLSIFLQALNYLVDAYLMLYVILSLGFAKSLESNDFASAASAIAANTFLRSIAAAVFPLFSMYMFNAIHVNWSGTLLGCVAALLVPIPIIFYKYGLVQNQFQITKCSKNNLETSQTKDSRKIEFRSYFA